MDEPDIPQSTAEVTATVTKGGSLPPNESAFLRKGDAVTVIIPTYRRPDALDRALRSVLSQTWPPGQLIVVDDGSNDCTPEVVRRYPSAQLIQQGNAGPAAARNRGLREATGKYVASLDHDDVWDPKFLETAVTALEEHQADVAWLNFRQNGHPAFADHLKVRRKQPAILTGWSKGTLPIDEETAQEFFLLAEGPGSNSALVMTHEAIAAGWHKETKLADDLVLMASILARPKRVRCLIVGTPLWTKQQDAQSFSHETPLSLQQCVDDFTLISTFSTELFSPRNLRRWRTKAANLRYKLAYQHYWQNNLPAATQNLKKAFAEAGITPFAVRLVCLGVARGILKIWRGPAGPSREEKSPLCLKDPAQKQ